MGMFLNYQQLADNYVPNNLVCSFPKAHKRSCLDPVQASKPYEEYNVKGELIGYFWRYGESLNLEFNIDGEITIESDAIVLQSSGQVPPMTNINLYQRAYNVADMLSWTCVNIVEGVPHWQQDDEFTYDISGTKSVYISAEDFLSDKYVDITLYNFRHNPVYTKKVKASPKIIFEITPELSRKLTKGIYYCSLVVYNDNVNLPIFTNNDCTLLVK